MKKLILLTQFTLFIFLTNAQDYVFSVLANKGSNSIQQGTRWNNLSTGFKVYQGNKIKISEGGYAGLMHKSGKTVELKTAGEYDIMTLETKLHTKTSNYAEKYAKFAMNSTENIQGNANYDYNVTGSVERGIDDYFILAKDEIKMIKSLPLTISWMTEIDEDVEVRVITLFGETLYKVKTENQSATIDLSDIADEGKMFLVNIYDIESGEALLEKGKRINMIMGKEAKPIKEEYALLKKELDENSAMDQLIFASFFSEKGLENYTASHLHKASMLAKNVSDYEGAYLKYLEEQGIIEKKEKK